MGPEVAGSAALNPGVLDTLNMLGQVGGFINLAVFLLVGWGLYLINKKSGEEYPWLAFIPLIQIYSFVKAGGKDGIWVLWLILGYIAFVIPGLIMTIMIIHDTSKRTGNGVGTTLLTILFPYIMYPVMGNNMSEGSVKTETISL